MLKPEVTTAGEMMVLIDGAHIRAANGYQSRHLDVTVGKIEVQGKPPWRFALAPRGAGSPLATLRQTLREQGTAMAICLPMCPCSDLALDGRRLVRIDIAGDHRPMIIGTAVLGQLRLTRLLSAFTAHYQAAISDAQNPAMIPVG